MNPEKNSKRERFIEDLTIEKGKTAREGFSLAQDFFNKISTEYPGLGYPDREAMDPFNPDRKDRETQRTAITYGAHVNKVVVGILTGEEIMGEEEGEEGTLIFRGQVLLVDPKFQHTTVAERLMAQVQADYEHIILSPGPFRDKNVSGGEHFSQTRMASRREALRRLYRRFGFEEHKRENTMSWKKEKNEEV